MSPQERVEQKATQARESARVLGRLSTSVKNGALESMAESIVDRQEYLIEANHEDVKAARESKMSDAMIDRLMLTESRIESMAVGLRQVVALPDPIGEVVAGWRRPNGLQVNQVRVPLGVVGVIYESRPNVTVDCAGLCLKSGNAVLLRGGSEAIHSNIALTNIIAQAATEAGVPPHAIQLIDVTDRAAAQHMMRLNKLIDVLIPRGGAGLIQTVIENATVPVIETGVGNCHLYIDADADLDMAEEIAFNAKVQRPSVCNAIETMLVHESVADEFLPRVCRRLAEAKVEIRGDDRTLSLFPAARPATDEDWDTEFLALILAVKVVGSLDDAIEHINEHGTRHSEAIITNDFSHSQRFTEEVDAAAVYVNASTRFTDGFEFGLGAEVGISTQKLHARGPMGLEALTTTKFVVTGSGQVRE